MFKGVKFYRRRVSGCKLKIFSSLFPFTVETTFALQTLEILASKVNHEIMSGLPL